MSLHSPSLMSAGAASIISPDGSDQIPAELWAEYAAIVLLEPEPELLSQWVRRLEDALGVRDVHRIAIEGGETAVREHIQSLRPAQTEGRSELPSAERGRSLEDVRRMDRLLARLARKDLKKDQRDAAERELARLEMAPHDAAEANWRESMIGETTALEAARGHTVERGRSGAVRIDRCPILRLLRCGKLTAEQFDTAMNIRDLYDARSEGIGSQLGAVNSGSGAHNNNAFVLAKLQRAKALQKLGAIERRVALECRDEPACLQMLRAVVGERVSLSALGEGRAFERHAKALARALDAAA
jgi:hypothetical protein